MRSNYAVNAQPLRSECAVIAQWVRSITHNDYAVLRSECAAVTQRYAVIPLCVMAGFTQITQSLRRRQLADAVGYFFIAAGVDAGGAVGRLGGGWGVGSHRGGHVDSHHAGEAVEVRIARRVVRPCRRDCVERAKVGEKGRAKKRTATLRFRWSSRWYAGSKRA